jgi:hypothetical protein
MSDSQMLTVLRHKAVAPKDWSAKGPEGVLTVLEHSRAIPESMKSGTITFKVKTATGEEHTLVGTIAPEGTESVTKDGTALPHGSVDGGIASHVIVRGFPPRVRVEATVIVHFFSDPEGDNNEVEYRFEGKIGKTNLPLPGL